MIEHISSDSASNAEPLVDTSGPPPIATSDLERAGISVEAPVEETVSPLTNPDDSAQPSVQPSEKSDEPAVVPEEGKKAEPAIDATGEAKDALSDKPDEPSEGELAERKRRIGLQTVHQKSTDAMKVEREQSTTHITGLETALTQANAEVESTKNEIRALLKNAQETGEEVDTLKQFDLQNALHDASRNQRDYKMQIENMEQVAMKSGQDQIQSFIADNNIPTDVSDKTLGMLKEMASSRFAQYGMATLTQKAIGYDWLMSKLDGHVEKLEVDATKQARKLVMEQPPRTGGQPDVAPPKSDKPDSYNGRAVTDKEWNSFAYLSGSGGKSFVEG